MPFLTGICDCCKDTSGCCDVIWCTPCQMGRQCNAVKGLPDSIEMGPCLCACFLPIFMPCLITKLRSLVKEKYMITEEGACMTCLCGFCCGAFSLCQTSRELNLRDANTGGTCYTPAPKIN